MGVLEDIRAENQRRREEYERGYHWPQYPPRRPFEAYTIEEINAAWELIHKLGYYSNQSAGDSWVWAQKKYYAICRWEDISGGHALPAVSRETGEEDHINDCADSDRPAQRRPGHYTTPSNI